MNACANELLSFRYARRLPRFAGRAAADATTPDDLRFFCYYWCFAWLVRSAPISLLTYAADATDDDDGDDFEGVAFSADDLFCSSLRSSGCMSSVRERSSQSIGDSFVRAQDRCLNMPTKERNGPLESLRGASPSYRATQNRRYARAQTRGVTQQQTTQWMELTMVPQKELDGEVSRVYLKYSTRQLH